MTVSSDLLFFLAGAAFTAFVGWLAIFPRTRDYYDKRRHVRGIDARLEAQWIPVDATLRQMTGAQLRVRNSSRWPVTNLVIVAPGSAVARDRNRLGSNDEWVEDLFLDEALMGDLDEAVTIQVTDVQGVRWSWTPATGVLTPNTRKLPPLQRLVQRWSRRWSPSAHARFARLPRRIRILLWGYDPRG